MPTTRAAGNGSAAAELLYEVDFSELPTQDLKVDGAHTIVAPGTPATDLDFLVSNAAQFTSFGVVNGEGLKGVGANSAIFQMDLEALLGGRTLPLKGKLLRISLDMEGCSYPGDSATLYLGVAYGAKPFTAYEAATAYALLRRERSGGNYHESAWNESGALYLIGAGLTVPPYDGVAFETDGTGVKSYVGPVTPNWPMDPDNGDLILRATCPMGPPSVFASHGGNPAGYSSKTFMLYGVLAFNVTQTMLIKRMAVQLIG